MYIKMPVISKAKAANIERTFHNHRNIIKISSIFLHQDFILILKIIFGLQYLYAYISHI